MKLASGKVNRKGGKMRIERTGLVASVILGLVLMSTVQGIPDFPDSYEMQTVASLPTFPTDMCFLPQNGQGQDRFVVAMKDGYVIFVENGVVSGVRFLDIQDITNSFHDRGLTGCAVHEERKEIYVLYTYEDGRGSREKGKTAQVARFNINSDWRTANKGSKKVVMGTVTGPGCEDIDEETNDVLCAEAFTHANGGLGWDGDMNLLVTMGDGGGNSPSEKAVRAQKIDSLNGKVLRIMVDGKGVPSNPFYESSNPSSNRSKVYALGFRNPWRIIWDGKAGGPIVSEVGWSSFEELNFVRNGGNYGWPCKEASQTNQGYANFFICKQFNNGNEKYGTRQEPTVSWPHWEGAASSGLVKLGKQASNWAEADKAWIYYTDYVFGWMRRVMLDGNGNVIKGPEKFATDLGGPVSVQLGPSKDMFYVSLAAREVRKIVYKPDPNPPRVELVNPPNGNSNVEFTTSIKIVFSKNVKVTSLRNGFTLKKRGSSSNTSGTMTFDSGSDTATFKPDSPLDANSVYEVTVSEVKGEDDRRMTSTFRSSFTTGELYSLYVSDLEWTNEQNGVGPIERDQSNGKNERDDGEKITIRDEVYDKGVGMVPYAELTVKVPNGCGALEGVVGIDDSVTKLDDGASYGFITSQGRTLLSTPLMSRVTDPITFSVDVTAGQNVKIRIELGGTNNRVNRNRVSWGDLLFRCTLSGSLDTTPPEVKIIRPKDGNDEYQINKDPSVKFTKPMDQITLLRAVKVTDPNDNELPFAPEFNEASDLMKLIMADFQYDTQYKIKVGINARDTSGRRLEAPVESFFKTQQVPASGLLIAVDQLKVEEEEGESRFEKRRGLRVQRAGAEPITKVYEKGIHMKAPMVVKYDLRGLGCNTYKSQISIDGRVDGLKAKAKLQIKLDGQVVVDRELKASTFAEKLQFSVSGKQTIEFSASIGGSEFDGEFVTVGNARVECSGGSTYFSDMTPSSQNGSGFLRNDETWERHPLSARTEPEDGTFTKFTTGIRQHATSTLKFKLPDRCASFESQIGVDLLSQLYGEMIFTTQISGPGVSRNCVSPILNGGDGLSKLECPLDGATNLNLFVGEGSEGRRHDIGIWGDAYIDCAPTALDPVAEIDDLPETFVIGDTVNFSGNGYNFKGLKQKESKLRWDIILHHCDSACHTHQFLVVEGKKSGSFKAPDHGQVFYFAIHLTTCHGSNPERCVTTSKSVNPKLKKVTATSNVDGFTVGVDSLSGSGPLTAQAVVGAKVTLSAASQQGGRRFVRWAENGSTSNTFSITVTDDRTFTAVYE